MSDFCPTTSGNWIDCDAPAVSLTSSVTNGTGLVAVTAVNGPEITPVAGSRVRPDGSVPEATRHV